jgi:transglutaminase-like putative cysteine protease
MLSAVVFPLGSSASEFLIAAADPWVTKSTADVESSIAVDQASVGVYYLLFDQQTRVLDRSIAVYWHVAMKALNERGVEEAAHVEISFNPSYQTLTLHSINVIRDGKVLKRLNAADVRMLQRERDLEFRMFDGTKTANVFLTDVRIGDVVEHSYTVRGANPVFANRLSGRHLMQWSVPVHEMRFRLLWPRGRSIHFRPINTDLQPSVAEFDGAIDYRWERSRVAPLALDDEVPSWYLARPEIHWSEYATWRDVTDWAMPLYRVSDRLSPPLGVVVERIRKEHASEEARLQAALRLVQGEIRYLAVEIGAGSHRPTAPEVVLQRRYGDCKDKTLLLLSLLSGLGLDARAALVHTKLGRGIASFQPSPNAFNHVLVNVHLAGRQYWLDPTRPPQRAPLDRLYQPDFGLALLVEPKSDSLVTMSNTGGNRSKRTVRAVFDVPADPQGATRYTITTVHEGGSAESAAADFASRRRVELQNRYLNFYASYYPNLAIASPMIVEEDEQANRFTVTEYYEIGDFWSINTTLGRREAQVHTPDLAEYLRSPRSPIRAVPLAVPHPVDVTHLTEVRLPEVWDASVDHAVVDDKSFRFERRTTVSGQTIQIADRFLSKSDHVLVPDVAAYVSSLERARDAVGFTLYWSAADTLLPLSRRLNWPVMIAAALMLVAFALIAFKVYRYDPPAPAEVSGPQLRGIKGWLLLPALGVLAMPAIAVRDLYSGLDAYSMPKWTELTAVGSDAYHALWAPVLLFELSFNLLLLVFSVLLVALFFQRRTSAPTVYIAVVAAAFLLSIVGLFLAKMIPAAAALIDRKDWLEALRNAINVAIWTAYFVRSRRVKSTFRNGYQPPFRAVTGPALQPFGSK